VCTAIAHCHSYVLLPATEKETGVQPGTSLKRIDVWLLGSNSHISAKGQNGVPDYH